MHIEHISVSRKKVFDLCQMKYRFQYHYSIKDGVEPIYFAYGKIVHKIGELYVQNKGEKLIHEIAHEVLSEGVEGQKVTLPQEYRNRLPFHLKSLKKITDKVGFEGKTEYPFKHDLDPPNKRYVKGVIDRLIQNGDKFYIVDYKTTKQTPWRVGPKNILDDLQLRCYARAVQRDFGAKAENINCALYYLEGEEVVGARFSEETLKRTDEELLQAYLQIANTKPEDALGRVGEWCRRCEYKRVCSCYSLT